MLGANTMDSTQETRLLFREEKSLIMLSGIAYSIVYMILASCTVLFALPLLVQIPESPFPVEEIL